VSILQQVNLPAQPASGDVTFVPLGGNGWTSPKSMYYWSIDQTGDVSGGTATIDVGRDERFEMLIDFMEVQNIGGAVVFRLDIFRNLESRALVVGTSTADATISTALWSPPAIIDPFEWRMSIPNVDGIVSRFKGVVYNFNIRASEVVPLSTLLASVRRSSSLI
jgi:hypothetical protein